MASLLGALLEILRMLRSSVKDRIRRFPRSCWALLLAYLSRKFRKWWCSWPSKPGSHENTKPADPSFPRGRGGSCLVSCSGSARRAARVAASTVPASANAVNRLSRDGAESQPETPPPSSSSISATLPVDPPWVPSLDLNSRSHWVGEEGPTTGNHNSGNPTVQSAGDRSSVISISRTSSRASVQNDRSSRDPSPRATHRQFGPGSRASQSRGRSSRSPSPRPSPMNSQISTGFPSASRSSHTREQLSSPAIHRVKQKTTSIGWDIQNPSTESLPVETSTRPPPRVSLADRSETALQHSHVASSAQPNQFVLPKVHIVQLINSDQIPRYTKNITTQVDYFFHSHAVFTHVNRPREEKMRSVKPLTTTFP